MNRFTVTALIIFGFFTSSGFSYELIQPQKEQPTKIDVLKGKPLLVTSCNVTQSCPDGLYCSIYAGKKYCTEQEIPPTCLPATEPNCGLTGECPENYYCSRFESLEYCCITAPLGPS